MATMTRRDLFQETALLHDAMSQLFANGVVRPRGWAGAGPLPLDLYETEHEYVARLAVPGLKPDNFEITLERGVLTIHGRTQQERPEGVRYHVQEHRYGDFTRTIQFSAPVDADKIDASLADGILTLNVPKAEAAKPKRINITAN